MVDMYKNKAAKGSLKQVQGVEGSIKMQMTDRRTKKSVEAVSLLKKRRQYPIHQLVHQSARQYRRKESAH